MQIYIPKNHPVHTIFDIMAQADYDIRIVGGYVRDMIQSAGHMSKTDVYALDMDMATTARPEQVKQIFKDYKVIPVGFTHGTIRVVLPHKDSHKIFEITTLRQDIKTDGRHAVVAFSDNWYADCQRRDLTINGLYADRDGTVYDYCNGIQDIKHNVLRFIGDAKHRITEDALRILRFWRFVVKTGGTYDRRLHTVFKQMAPLVGHLSRERICAEMLKMLSYPNDPSPAIHAMQDCGVMARILPFPIASHMPLMSPCVARGTDIYAKIIALCNGEYTHVKTLGDVWGLSTADKRRLNTTISIYNNRAFAPPMVGRFLYYYGYPCVLTASRLKNPQMIDTVQSFYPYKKPEFPVTGNDLIAMGIPSGAKLGAMLKSLESWWVNQNCKPRKQDCLIMVNRLK